MSLSLRFVLLSIGLLLAAVFTLSYLFDRERTAALKLHEREQIKLHAERTADEFQRQLEGLHSDILFLAQTPPLQSLRHAIRESSEPPKPALFASQFAQLEQLFLAFAHARPAYLQLRLIGLDAAGQELVRIDRRGQSLLAVEAKALQHKGERYYVEQAKTLQEGQVQLSRIDLNREHGRISMPETITLRAVTPVTDGAGQVFALVVINLTMAWVFERMQQFLPSGGQMFLVNDEGYFLYHPDPSKAMTFDRSEPYRFEDAFPDINWPDTRLESSSGRHYDRGRGTGTQLVYTLGQQLSASAGPIRNLTLVVTEPASAVQRAITSARNSSYLAIALLMGVTIVLAVLMTDRMTRSLRALVRVSETISQGHVRYRRAACQHTGTSTN